MTLSTLLCTFAHLHRIHVLVLQWWSQDARRSSLAPCWRYCYPSQPRTGARRPSCVKNCHRWTVLDQLLVALWGTIRPQARRYQSLLKELADSDAFLPSRVCIHRRCLLRYECFTLALILMSKSLNKWCRRWYFKEWRVFHHVGILFCWLNLPRYWSSSWMCGLSWKDKARRNFSFEAEKSQIHRT